jgi:hypothetical protein
MLPLLVGGCATQGGAPTEVATPAASAPHVAAAVPLPADATPQPASAVARPTKGTALPPPGDNEMRHGIQITQVGLTAAGGLVDVRFKVLDAEKARRLLGDPANMPMLIAKDNPPLMPPHHALKGAKFSEGLVFYILYPNVRSAIKPGLDVTVAMGDVRLGPVAVQ